MEGITLYNVRRFEHDIHYYDNPALIEQVARYLEGDKVYKVVTNTFYGYVLERLGIDYILMRGREVITLQLKIRDSKYYMKDICIELYHEFLDRDSRNRKERGNIYDLKADYIVYAWLKDKDKDKDKDNKQDNNYTNKQGNKQEGLLGIMPNILLINVAKLKRFFDRNKSRYDIVPTKGTEGKYEKWITYNMFIPLEDCKECYEVIKLSE